MLEFRAPKQLTNACMRVPPALSGTLCVIMYLFRLSEFFFYNSRAVSVPLFLLKPHALCVKQGGRGDKELP
jgi:hypothetical protein